MKTAIFKYDHKDFPEHQTRTINLGDYVQSIAASQYFSKIDRVIDRDELFDVKEDLSVIGNGWYTINQHHVIPEKLNFLPVSIHINNRTNEIIDIVKSWTKNGPIGCRDISTMEFLQRGGIDCYFSSCLTTTLNREKVLSGKEKHERKGIYLADVDIDCKVKVFPISHFFDSLKKYQTSKPWTNAVKQFLKHFDGEDIEITQHECSPTYTHEQRFEMAENLLTKYAQARCVITSRIHCALPCLALGTPVVLVTPSYDTLRYRGIDKFFNHIWLDENGKLSQQIDTLHGEIVNNDEFVSKANALKQRCFDFVKQHNL